MKKNLYLITPCSRIKNLFKIKKKIKFEKIKKWIIIYDLNVIKKQNKLFPNNENIIEFFHKDEFSVSGNSQRNFALEYLNKKKDKNFFIYYLDDDNILHKNFYKLIDKIDNNKMNFIYTFDQLRKQKMHINNNFEYVKILKGDVIKTGYIDIAMFLPNFSLINNIRWPKRIYTADGEYIVKCMKDNIKNHRYLPVVACHYNFISNNLMNKIKERVLRIYKKRFKNQ